MADEDTKKAGRKPKLENPKTISFKVNGADYDSLKDLAFASGKTVSDVLAEFVKEFVGANKRKIAAFRRQKNSTVKATFLSSSPATPPPEKSARTSRKKEPAQVELKGGEDVAEN